jgi:fatty acid desaturase
MNDILPTTAPANDFAGLRRLLMERGLLRRQPGYFTYKIIITFLLYAAAIISLFFIHSVWLLVLDAVFLAFVYGQLGLLGHDAGHHQIFRSTLWNDVIAYPCTFALGISLQGWNHKHNEHHANPNHEDMDPDIDFPFVAFSEKQVEERKGLLRWFVRNQGWLFFPLLSFVSITLRISGIKHMIGQPWKKIWLDMVGVVLHFVSYFCVLFLLFPFGQALLFIVVHQMLFGLYMGMVFAPNHKGMPIMDENVQMDYLRQQVVTSRNVRGNPLTDFWYGGLNYQIEHHLFPTMPRNNLAKARPLVKAYCAQKDIPYHETGVWQSYREILTYMRGIARYARRLPS